MEKGFTEEDILKLQAALPAVFELKHAFNVFTFGEETLQRLGLTADDYTTIDAEATRAGRGVLAAGNFSITATLLRRFAVEAARHVVDVEVIDYASPSKSDTPSGTARELAEVIGAMLAKWREFRRIDATAERFIREVTPSHRGQVKEAARLRNTAKHKLWQTYVANLKATDFAAWRDERLKQVDAALAACDGERRQLTTALAETTALAHSRLDEIRDVTSALIEAREALARVEVIFWLT